jgi:hypothetical protein
MKEESAKPLKMFDVRGLRFDVDAADNVETTPSEKVERAQSSL